MALMLFPGCDGGWNLTKVIRSGFCGRTVTQHVIADLQSA
jgi:hypothetical protein